MVEVILVEVAQGVVAAEDLDHQRAAQVGLQEALGEMVVELILAVVVVEGLCLELGVIGTLVVAPVVGAVINRLHRGNTELVDRADLLEQMVWPAVPTILAAAEEVGEPQAGMGGTAEPIMVAEVLEATPLLLMVIQ